MYVLGNHAHIGGSWDALSHALLRTTLTSACPHEYSVPALPLQPAQPPLPLLHLSGGWGHGPHEWPAHSAGAPPPNLNLSPSMTLDADTVQVGGHAGVILRSLPNSPSSACLKAHAGLTHLPHLHRVMAAQECEIYWQPHPTPALHSPPKQELFKSLNGSGKGMAVGGGGDDKASPAPSSFLLQVSRTSLSHSVNLHA